jgi:crotonobetainyl-CoA:carnitine CoA-transferase CaiB-like acyl-CoA transferase
MKPLEGMRILSIEQFGAAPYGSMFLADLGAELIKIENKAIGGDPSRHTGPYLLGADDSLYFQSWHANKRSISIDLKSPEGRQDLERLVATADAVIDNLRGDLPEKLGLDYQSLAHLKPDLVCLHISAYGRDNERAAWPGYDFLMQAEVGLMHLTGDPDGPPSRCGPSIIDYMTGMTGMVGLLACLRRARETGQGCDVDTCLFDVALHQLGYTATWYMNEGYQSQRLARSAHFSVTPVQTFPTADGWIFVMCMTDKFWEALLAGLSRLDLGSDPRFSSAAARTEHRDRLSEILDVEFRRQTNEYWISKLGSVLPIAPVLDMEQALNNPFIEETGMVDRIAHPLRPGLKVLANPLKIDGRRPGKTVGSALGADNHLLNQAAARTARKPQ